MIYIFAALYPEAKPLIQGFGLKRAFCDILVPFDVWMNENRDISLVLTGAGQTAAATAVGCIWGRTYAGENDMLVNIGSCGVETSSEIGKIFLCNKITDRNTGSVFYPDMIYRHAFSEAALMTENAVWKKEKEEYGKNDESVKLNNLKSVDRKEYGQINAGQAVNEQNILHDMEGAALYQAASFWAGPHQMHFLKIATDMNGEEKIMPKQLEKMIAVHQDEIVQYVQQLQIIQREHESRNLHEKEYMSESERLCQELCCSQTMRNSVQQCLKYWTLSQVDYMRVLQEWRVQKKLPCRDKKEGKMRFEELKRKLL